MSEKPWEDADATELRTHCTWLDRVSPYQGLRSQLTLVGRRSAEPRGFTVRL
jgi:hypothetical protein